MEYLFIYLLQVADLFSNGSLVLLGFSIFIWIVNCLNTNSGAPSLDKEVIRLPLILLILALAIQILPTKQTLLLMGGTYLGKKAVNAVVTDEKIKKVDTIINLQLDKYIKELQDIAESEQ